jgi:hypothetical protein
MDAKTGVTKGKRVLQAKRRRRKNMCELDQTIDEALRKFHAANPDWLKTAQKRYAENKRRKSLADKKSSEEEK